MKTFDTPSPVAVTVEIGIGNVTFAASDRPDTTVDVQPSRPDRGEDVKAAEGTVVEFAGGGLVVKAPKSWRRYARFGAGGSVDVRVQLPAGSQVVCTAGVASLGATGALGVCRFANGMGDITLDGTANARLRTGFGAVRVAHVAGDADIATGSGELRIGVVDGALVAKNSNGHCGVTSVRGDAQVKSANGEIVVEDARAGLAAKTANGAIRLGRVSRGSVVAETAVGSIEIGIAEGSAAWLDLDTRFGEVVSELAAADQPDPDAEVVEVRARTAFGDVTIRRRSAVAAVEAANGKRL